MPGLPGLIKIKVGDSTIISLVWVKIVEGDKQNLHQTNLYAITGQKSKFHWILLILLVQFRRESPWRNQSAEAVLLTYEDLAQIPQRIDLDVPSYSHETQMGSGIQMTTFNGTRTYDFRGSPNDSDND